MLKFEKVNSTHGSMPMDMTFLINWKCFHIWKHFSFHWNVDRFYATCHKEGWHVLLT
jgi:hypothetical protein